MQVLKEGDEYLLKSSEIVTVFSMKDFVLSLYNYDEKEILMDFHCLF